MSDKTRDQMNNGRWDNPCALGDQVDRSNQQTTSSGKVERTGQRFSLHCSDDLRAKIELPSCRQYKPGDFLAFRPLNWDEIIDEVNDADSTKSDGEYDLEHDPSVDTCMEDDMDTPDGVDLDGDVDMETDSEDEEDQEEEDEKEEDGKEEEVVDEDEDNGKEPRTIGQGEVVNTSAEDADTMVDDQPTVLPGQGQEMCEYTPRPPPAAPAPRP